MSRHLTGTRREIKSIIGMGRRNQNQRRGLRIILWS
nr:MAG TPA: hypothetical protein [Caudoviricetes sp.]